MFIVHRRKIFYLISGTLVLASIVAIILWGLNFGIDFKGGSLMEIQFIKDRPSNADIQTILTPLNLGETTIQPSAEKDMIIRTLTMTEEIHQKALSAIKSKYEIEESKFESVGPAIGQELKRKA
ncbi:MAG: protein translocase subunit SecF, partial [Candidatus Portnoybacteria bacterium]|nr:protein translocase subunit SecF [Candidatus Portnoybacteria bacterium]